MAKEQTEKSKFPSKYSPSEYVTAAQYITELICENKANYDRVHIGLQFWKQKEWAAFYKQQIFCAYNLLKLYEPEAIIQAIKKNKKTYSLKAPWLIDAIDKEIISKPEAKDSKEAPDTQQKPQPKPRVTKESILAKLRNL